jgi:plastocyanin
MRMRIAPIAVAAGAALLLPACPAIARTTIPIKGIAFTKESARVDRGEQVVWKDRDAHVTHTVSSRGEHRFASSGSLREGDAHSVKFRRSGIYRYVCRVHPANMRARIIVE